MSSMEKGLDLQHLGALSRTLSIKIDYRTLIKMEYLMKHYRFDSRSDFVRRAIMFKISKLRSEGLISGK